MSLPSKMTRIYSYITFGKRPRFPDGPHADPWHNDIPLLGHDHWQFSSKIKKLNGKQYNYSDGTAELDTGAAFCYLDDDFVKDYYTQIPAATTINLSPDRSQERHYQLIPVKAKVTARAATHWLGPTEYYIGALQPKSLLMSGHGGAYHGPDLIGRVALVNMQIVLQFPENKAHTMSWQRKKTNFAGPSTQHW
ncbi:hypothetical protein B0H10DRAFT_2248589 [Mycena sp. CBHHK59/15]|nr:hypothetical protein B0H10DRAFT_2248589 [Mycena sp. CBHHK59/15]